MKKIPIVLVLLFGLFCVYGGFHRILFKGGFTVEVLGVWGFGIVLICVGIGKLLDRLNNMFLTFVENKLVVKLYTVGSLLLGLCCVFFTYIFFGLNIKTLFGIIGVLLFGIGSFVILFFDWRKFVRKNYKMEYMDEADTWVIMDGHIWSDEIKNWIKIEQ